MLPNLVLGDTYILTQLRVTPEKNNDACLYIAYRKLHALKLLKKKKIQKVHMNINTPCEHNYSQVAKIVGESICFKSRFQCPNPSKLHTLIV